MRKFNLLILLIWLSVPSTFANTIGVSYALQVAQNFYQQANAAKAVTLTLTYERINTDSTDGLPIGEPLYYVFNAGDNQGFVMVSADDAVKPILGYNTKGQFVIQNAPPVITDWLEKYGTQIAYAKVNHTAPSGDIIIQWRNYYSNVVGGLRDLTTPVWPLLTTTYDQGQYYNAMCPSDPSSMPGYAGNVPTGCGATAMCQIMRYWNYPAQGIGSNTDTSSSTIASYGSLSVNFGGANYNWSNMPNSVTSANTDVATVMYDCGVAVNMTYGPTESSCSLLSCSNAYTAYFGYDTTFIQILQKSDTDESDWMAIIQNELTNSRPIQYSGTGAGGGHTFVLDGSDGNGNFHINWGWSGVNDGFYSISTLNPAILGAGGGAGGFDNNEAMIIGIQPANYYLNTSNIQLNSVITITPNPITFDQTFTVNADLSNQGDSDFNGSYCAALFDSSGTFIRYIGAIITTSSLGGPLSAGQDYSGQGGLTFSDAVPLINVPGNDTIGVYYQPLGATTWTLAGTATYPDNPISVAINGPTDAADGIQLYIPMTVYSSVVYPNTFVQGETDSVGINLINNGTNTYTGQYEVILLDLYGNSVQQIGTYTESNGLAAGTSYPTSLTIGPSSITAPEGQYLLAVAEEASGTSTWNYCGAQSYPNPIYVNVVNEGIFASIGPLSLNIIHVFPNPANNTINIDAGGIRGKYDLAIFNVIGQQMAESNGILSGQKLSSDVSSFATGMYTIQLKTESETINSKLIVK